MDRSRHPHRKPEEGAPQPLDRDRPGARLRMVVVFYVVTIVKFGPGILDRAM